MAGAGEENQHSKRGPERLSAETNLEGAEGKLEAVSLSNDQAIDHVAAPQIGKDLLLEKEAELDELQAGQCCIEGRVFLYNGRGT